jgi:hypothetical protein
MHLIAVPADNPAGPRTLRGLRHSQYRHRQAVFASPSIQGRRTRPIVVHFHSVYPRQYAILAIHPMKSHAKCNPSRPPNSIPSIDFAGTRDHPQLPIVYYNRPRYATRRSTVRDPGLLSAGTETALRSVQCTAIHNVVGPTDRSCSPMDGDAETPLPLPPPSGKLGTRLRVGSDTRPRSGVTRHPQHG